MTETEWLASENPQAMLDQVKGKVSDRKLRLFSCACCRRIWHLLTDERSRNAVEVAERFADGLATAEELHATRAAAWAAAWVAGRDAAWDVARAAAGDAAGDAAGTAAGDAAGTAAWVAAWVAAGDAAGAAEGRAQAHLLRDIVGNPFRPVVSAADWLTHTVLSLAQAAYEERGRKCGRCKGKRDWHDALTGDGKCFDCHGTGRLDDGTLDNDRLAVLADALEDAGCADETILTHLRSPGPHVRGCWVVDLLLRKP